nr:sodium/glutamate symporter [Veillonella denticariosi]
MTYGPQLVHVSDCSLAIITLFIGTWINKHSRILQRMCMPAPAVGGPYHLHF